MRKAYLRRLIATALSFAVASSIILVTQEAMAQDPPRIERGNSGPLVSRVQEILLKLMYVGVKKDAKFGPSTEAAVRRFQQREGISPVDGIVGVSTWAKLEARARDGSVSLDACAPPPTIARNASGPCVEEIQRKLNQQLRLTLKVDGKFGPAVEKAVKVLQRTNGLAEDGKVGRSTWEKLRA